VIFTTPPIILYVPYDAPPMPARENAPFGCSALI